MTEQLSIRDINAMSKTAFVFAFGEIAEHSPWVAKKAFAHAPFDDLAALVKAFEQAIMGAAVDRQLELICAHPDLAGKAAIAGELGEASTAEQKQAGIDALSKGEYARFSDLNNRYKEKFGFPFILAVKGATKAIILEAFTKRLENDKSIEFKEALKQICRIMKFRLEERVK